MLQNPHFLVTALLTAILLLALLTAAVLHWPAFSVFDRRLQRRLITQKKSKPLLYLSKLLSPKADVAWCFLIAACLALSGRWQLGIWALATLGLADVAGILSKRFVKRRRPYNRLPEEVGYSYPSGHTLGLTCLALILLRVTAAGSWLPCLLFIIWIFLIKARLQLGAHYPADIAAAILLALSSFCATSLIYLII